MTSRTTFFESSSRLSAKTDSHALALTARHHFESYSYYQVKPPCAGLKSAVPDNVNVVSSGRLELVLLGHLNGFEISPDTCVKSHLAQYIVGFFRTNSAELSIEHVSDALIDEDDQAKVLLTFNQSRDPQHPQVPLRVTLRTIHLHLALSTIARSPVESFVPSTIQNSFVSEQMSLPIQGLVENVIGRFVTWHLVRGLANSLMSSFVISNCNTFLSHAEAIFLTYQIFLRRYPLIFGTWNKQLGIEIPLFSKTFRAIVEMVERSANTSFKLKYNSIIKTLRLQLMDALVTSRSTLSDYLQTPDQDQDISVIPLSDEMVFCISMEQLYRAGMKRPQFRGSTDVLMTSSDVLDDDTLSHDHSITARSHSPAVTPQEVLWDVPAFSVSSIQDSDLEDHCPSPSDIQEILEEEGFAALHDSHADPTTRYENFNVWSSLVRQKKYRENSPNVLCFGTGQDDELELDWRSDSADSQEDYCGYVARADFEELTASAEDSLVDVDIEATECDKQLLELGDEGEIGMCISLLDTEEIVVIENECTDIWDEIFE